MNFEYIWFGHSSTCNYMTMVMQLHGMIFFVKIFEKQRSNVKVAWIQGKRSYYLQKMKQARLQPRTQALTFAHPPPPPRCGKTLAPSGHVAPRIWVLN